MKKNVRLFLYIALAFYLCGSQAFGQELSKQPPAQKSQTTAHPPPIFVYSPVFLQRFKQNINTSIQKYPSLKKYQQIATKGFFDTAEKALASTPIPYTGACYRAKDRHGASSLRIAATRDAHYARTLSTVVRIFPDSPDWSFALKSSDGKIDYHFYRDRALQSAKGYLLAWSRRMQSADGLIPGATPKLQPCPGEKPAAAQGMNVSILAYSFVSVYELLYPYLSADEVRDFKSWLDKLKQEIIEGEKAWIDNIALRQPYNNHLSFHLLGLISIAAANGDRDLFVEVIDGKRLGIVGSKDLKSMIEGAVYMESECSKSHYKTNPVCATFKRLNDSTRANELKRYNIRKMGCQEKHYFPKDHFPQTGEIWDRYRRVDKMKGSCAGKGMHYAVEHLRILTFLTLSAELNGFPMKNFVGKNGETLRSSYHFYARCLSETHNDGYLVSDNIKSCEYYKENLYPRSLINVFHLAAYLWNLNSPEAEQIINKEDQPLDFLDPLGYVQLMGFQQIH